jgi:hypothetical protein
VADALRFLALLQQEKNLGRCFRETLGKGIFKSSAQIFPNNVKNTSDTHTHSSNKGTELRFPLSIYPHAFEEKRGNLEGRSS